LNRCRPAVLGVRPPRVAEEWVNDRRRGSGRSHYGLSRTFAVLRDLPALPVLVRLPRRGLAFGRALGAAPVALVGGLLLAILAGLGWPAGLVPALLAWFATLLAAAGRAARRQARVGREAARALDRPGRRAGRGRAAGGPRPLRRRDLPLRPPGARDEAHHRRGRPGRGLPPLLRTPRDGAHQARLERVVELGAARPLHPPLSDAAPGAARPPARALLPPAGRRRHGRGRPRARGRRLGAPLPELAPPREDRQRDGHRARAHARLRGSLRETRPHRLRLRHPALERDRRRR